MFKHLKTYFPKKLTNKQIFTASGVIITLVLSFFGIALSQSRQPLLTGQTPPLQPQIEQGQVLPANSGGISFKTYKGLNFPWGINNKGVSTFRDWLSSKYDETTTTKAFDSINSMGVKTVGMWLWFDRMLVKDNNWGTDSYRTQFNPNYKANWESFLKNVVKPRGMEVVVTMFTPLSSTDRDPYNLELSTLVPVFAGANILGAGVANGDMAVDTNPKDNFPDSWSVNLGNPPAGSYSWENNDGTPGSPAKYLKITSTTGSTININSPKVPYASQGGLYALSVTYKGALVSFQTNYYDNAGKYLDRDYILAGNPERGTDPKGYSQTWKTFTWASRTAVIPAGTAQIGITAVADGNATTYIGPARIAPGGRNTKWRNYMQAAKDWVSMYGSNTEYGSSIASWHGIKEVSDGWMFHVTRDFSRDLYQAIKSTGTSQPVGIDNSPYFRLAVTEPKNQPWFSDAADYYSLHIYRDDATIPDTSKLDKPFILGEFGAENDCPNGGTPENGDCKPGETNLANPNADWNLNAVSKFYPNGKIAGAKTALGWAWVGNSTIADHKMDGTNVFGNAGEWIKNWNPGGTGSPTPTSTPTPPPAGGSITTPAANQEPSAPPPTNGPTPTANQNSLQNAPLSPPATKNSTNEPASENNKTEAVSESLLDRFFKNQEEEEATTAASPQATLTETTAILATLGFLSLMFGLFAFVIIP